MKIYIVNCLFNITQRLIDRAFQSIDDARAYVVELNGNKEKAVARCKELIARYEGESMVKCLDEDSGIAFVVMTTEMK